MSILIFLKWIFVSSITFELVLQTLTMYTIQNHRFEDRASFVLNTFEDVSLVQCVFECKKRLRCLAVEYRWLVKHCSLRSENTTSIKNPGFMVISGLGDAIHCGSSFCMKHEACETQSMECGMAECGYPYFDTLDFKGNIYRLGSMVETNCSNLKQYTCNATGQWERKAQLLYEGITCRDFKLINNNIQSGNYINRLGMAVYCDFTTDGGEWAVFQRRMDGSIDFFRTWEHYKNGFGDICGEFWLGLENIYTILHQSSYDFELRIDLEDWDGGMSYAFYDNFTIADEADEYRLHIGNYTGTAGDSLSYHDGRSFSTKDRGVRSDCATRFLGAWWYKGCYRSNLNAFYYPGPTVPVYATGINWWNLKNTHNYSLKSTAMMMREITTELLDFN